MKVFKPLIPIQVLGLLALMLISNTTLFSQERYLLAYEKQGDKEMNKGNYDQALECYNIARRFFKTPPRLYYKCGEASRLSQNYDKAEYWYEKLISEYDDEEDINKEYPYLYLNLARASLQNNNPAYSMEIIQNLLEDSPNLEVYNQAKQEYKRLDWIFNNQEPDPTKEVYNLGNNVNSATSQTGSFVQNDSILYFTHLSYTTHKDQYGDTYYSNIFNQIHYTYIDSLHHSPHQVLDIKSINRKNRNISNLCIDSLNQRIYFNICNNLNNNTICEIYYTENQDGIWKKAKKLGKNINLKGYNNTHPHITTHKGETLLYFSSNREGGYGGYDLWYINVDSLETNPINLGPSINTEGDEITPYYSIADETLYFSSNHHPGYGGYDLFSSKGWKQRWNKPQNLKMPINSSANETHPYIYPDQTKGYYSSNRPSANKQANKTCCYDIYKFYTVEKPHREPTLEKIRQEHPFIPALDLPLVLYFHNDQPDPGSIKPTTDLDYLHTLENYIKLQNHYKAQHSKGLRDSVETAALDSITHFFEIELNASKQKLNQMLEYLEDKLSEGNKIDLSIRGYSSSLHNQVYNYYLSERRIHSLKNHIKNWNNGVLQPYLTIIPPLDTLPQLHIKTLAIGKSQSTSPNPTTVEEKRKSIYRLDAIRERKIEIKLIEIR